MLLYYNVIFNISSVWLTAYLVLFRLSSVFVRVSFEGFMHYSVYCIFSGSVAPGGYVTASSVPDWHLPGGPFVCWSMTSASYSVLFAGSQSKWNRSTYQEMLGYPGAFPSAPVMWQQKEQCFSHAALFWRRYRVYFFESHGEVLQLKYTLDKPEGQTSVPTRRPCLEPLCS